VGFWVKNEDYFGYLVKSGWIFLLGRDLKSIKAGFWANRQDFFNFSRILRVFLVFSEKYQEITRNDEKLQEITRNTKKWQEMTKNIRKWREITRNIRKWREMMKNDPPLREAAEGEQEMPFSFAFYIRFRLSLRFAD